MISRRIKVRSDSAHCGAIAKRIITPTEVRLLIRPAPSNRDRVLLEVAYAGGLRVSDIVALNWADVLPRDEGRVQLSLSGKGAAGQLSNGAADAFCSSARVLSFSSPLRSFRRSGGYLFIAKNPDFHRGRTPLSPRDVF